MANYQTRVEQINAVQWVPNPTDEEAVPTTLDDVRAIFPEAFTRDGVLYIPTHDPYANLKIEEDTWAFTIEGEDPPKLHTMQPNTFAAEYEEIVVGP